jgi:hypothetical protein
MGMMKSMLIAGILSGGALAIQGCTVEPEPEPPPPPDVVEVAPYGYAYGPEYYDRGYYDDGYWYWHDHGRYYREAREDHERRMHEYREHEHFEHRER